jgi:hypothetical protein
MPRRAIDREQLEQKLLARLKRQGPQSRAALQDALGVSQPTVSRIIKKWEDCIVRIGQASHTFYAHKGDCVWPIFEVSRTGQLLECGELATLEPHHFLWSNSVFSDLPYFLFDLRPSGFLGRLVPAMHPELALPRDILTWSAHTTLRYLTCAGFNTPGNLIIGEEMAKQFLLGREGTKIIPRSKYNARATSLLVSGEPGSSAAGEQPKFVAMNEDGVHLIVKFSAPVNESVGRRMSDILIGEHLAMTLLRESGLSAAKTEIVKDGDRTFLEVERFDRIGPKGRQGVLSLGALAAEFVGEANSWSEASESLARQAIISSEWVSHIRLLEIFGHLIANSDMHHFNLSFLSKQGTQILALAPVYDMCPMAYAPRANQLVPHNFAPPVPRHQDRPLWAKALPLAMRFWNEVSLDSRVSKEFRSCAKKNLQILDEQWAKKMLPIEE